MNAVMRWTTSGSNKHSELHPGTCGDAEQGFTLIELMVVVLIIGILMAIAIPTFLGAQSAAQDRAAQSDLKAMLTAELSYYSSHGSYLDSSAANLPSIQALEPALSQRFTSTAPTTPAPTNQIYVQSTSIGGTAAQAVCVYEFSASGTVFGVESIATGLDGGTYFFSAKGSGAAIPTTCATPPMLGSTSSGDWSRSAAQVGF